MREARLVQVMATFMLTWMSFVTPKPDGSLLALALPKETFSIYDTRFNVRGDNVAYTRPRPRPLVRVPVPRPIGPQRIPTTTRQPIRVRITPAVMSPQRYPVVHPTNPWVSPQQQFVPRRQSNVQRAPPRGTPTHQNQFLPTDQSGYNPPRQNSGSWRPAGRDKMCGVMPVVGDCRAAFPRYFYNNRTDQCDCFLYGGCGNTGLESSYRNLEECLTTCLPSNKEEGPVCKEIFREEEVFFDYAVTNPPRRNPTPNTNHISDEHLLSLLVNSVSPEDFISYDSDLEYDQNNRDGRSNGRRNI